MCNECSRFLVDDDLTAVGNMDYASLSDLEEIKDVEDGTMDYGAGTEQGRRRMVVADYQTDKSVISPTTNTVFLDIEADGLNPTKIHCVVTKEIEREAHLTHLSRRSLMDELAKGGKVCGHNLVGYDLPVMRKLWGIRIPADRVVDTLVLSRLFHPDLDGGHSLAAWGTRLGFAKGSHDEWDELSPEMIEYCKRDVDVTQRLHDALMGQMQMFGLLSTVLI